MVNKKHNTLDQEGKKLSRHQPSISEWPEKKYPNKSFYKNYDDGYVAGFNTCHDAFMSAINEKERVVLPARDDLADILMEKIGIGVDEAERVADRIIKYMKERR